MLKLTSKTILCGLAIAALALPALADYDQGIALYKQGKYVESAAEWQAVVDASPDYAYGYYMLGNCYIKLKKYGDAAKNYRKAVELDSGKFQNHMMLGQALMQQKKFGDVVSALDKAEPLATSASQKQMLHKTRGLALSRTKSYDRARTDLRRAKPESNHTVASELARVCFNLDDLACTEKAVDQAVALKPNDSDLLELLAKHQLESARRGKNKALYRNAAGTARKLLAAKPGSAEAHELLGAALLGGDDYGQAVTEFEKVLAKQPKNCNAMLNIAQASSKLDDWNKVLSMSQRAAQCDPRSYMAHNQAAFAYNKMKRWDDAMSSAQKALSIKENGASHSIIETARAGKNAEATNAQSDADAKEFEAQVAAQKAAEAAEAERIRQYQIKTGSGDKKKD